MSVIFPARKYFNFKVSFLSLPLSLSFSLSPLNFLETLSRVQQLQLMISAILVSLNLRHRHLSVNRASRERQDILPMTRLQEMCATWTSRKGKKMSSERVIDQTIGRLARVLHKTEIRRFTTPRTSVESSEREQDEREFLLFILAECIIRRTPLSSVMHFRNFSRCAFSLSLSRSRLSRVALSTLFTRETGCFYTRMNQPIARQV